MRLLRERHSQATIECGFTLKRVRDMIRTYIQMHRTDKYPQHSWIIWPVSLNCWVFVYELSGCGFESSCSHLNFRFWACFKQGVPWHLGKYSVWIHYEMHTWHDKNIQSVRLFLFVIFPDIWKEINVNSYRLIGLLPIFIKNLKRIKRIVLLLATKDYDIWYQ